MQKWIAAFLLSLIAQTATGQQFAFSPPASRNSTALSHAMSRLAKGVLPLYRDRDRETFLDNRFRLEFVAQRYADAAKTIAELRGLPSDDYPPQAAARDAQYEILSRAEARSRRDRVSLADAFGAEFRALVRPLDNRTSALVMRLFNGSSTGGLSLLIDQAALQHDLDRALAAQKGKTTIALAEALALVRAYQIEESYKTFMPFAAPLVNEDDNRRYIVETNLGVPTPAGATVCVQIVRPRINERLPALLEFSIYAEPLTTMSEARRSASNEYVGITGFSRGKGCSPGQAVPEEHDGADAAALIDWIARQPWSDGRVGMFSGSYGGFTQWAAAKYMPKPLKAMMPSVTLAPGIDVPMEGSIRQSFSFYWPLYVGRGKGLNGAAFEDTARWNRLYHDWYVHGRAYRDLSKIAGIENPVWDKWVDHPDYDAYWQAMIPCGAEFSRIKIPVLTTTGYYDGGEIGALYYFAQHKKWLSDADHYLVVGPYNHISGQRGTIDVLGDQHGDLWGYRLDRAATLDIGVLRYQWFDYIFKNGRKPAILRDKVNYEVMGANIWRHAASLDAMANGALHFHLRATQAEGTHMLSTNAPAKAEAIEQTVNLADRSDANRLAPGGSILDRAIDTWLGLEFVSAPFANVTEVSGLFSGTLRFVTNKKDFDFLIQLYELTPSHEYFQLSWYLARASYIADRSHRHLLVPGLLQELHFTSGRLTSRLFARGSRLVMLIAAVRQPNIEINYGTGKDVGRETIADAKAPLDIKWLSSSVINIPVRE